MILGVGSDLLDVRRIERSLQRFGSRFVRRIFSDAEQRRAQSVPQPAWSYAKRFAAKEACAKALGSGLGRNKVSFRDFSIQNTPSGRPEMLVKGGALHQLHRRLAEMSIDCTEDEVFDHCHIHLSLSDEYPYAQAFVVIALTEGNR